MPDYFTTGGLTKVWYGAGVGRCVHSSVSAPSQGFSGAFLPLRMQCTTMMRNRICDRPKPKAPMETLAEYDAALIKDLKLPTASARPVNTVVQTVSQ